MSFLDILKKRFAATQAPTNDDADDRRSRTRHEVKPGTRVLIIDDSQTIVAALSRLMRQNNFTTYEAYDAESGLQMIDAELPDLLFLDIVLPGMSGFDALRRLRRDPRTQKLPIIMMSGDEAATAQFYVQRIGANDFMKKPFSRAELFAKVERVMGISALELKDDLPEMQISDQMNKDAGQ